MVRASYDQKPYRRMLMETYGAQVVREPEPGHAATAAASSPRPRTRRARWASRSARPSRTRSTHPTARSTRLGSVLDFVLLHQTVIGQESIEQMAMAGEEPDVIIACAGGGSNFAGPDVPVARPPAARRGGAYRVIAAEPEAAPSLTRGVYTYDFGDTGQMTPLVKMHTLGSSLHAAGRSTRAACATTAWRRSCRCSRSTASSRRGASTSARRSRRASQFARAEGILPAPEPTHAIKVAIDEALAAKEARRGRGSSCSTSAATATSTWRRTSGTCRARSRTTSTRPRSRRGRARGPARQVG